MTTPADLTNRWPLHGDPTRLQAAAALLRSADAEQVFGADRPGRYVMAGVARLLEALAAEIRERGDLGHDVVSAATDIAEHVLAYVTPGGQGGGGSAHPSSALPAAPHQVREPGP